MLVKGVPGMNCQDIFEYVTGELSKANPLSTLMITLMYWLCYCHWRRRWSSQWLGPGDAHMQWTGPWMVHLMAWNLFSTKPLPEPITTNYRLGPWVETSVKYESNSIFLIRKNVNKYNWNVSKFAQTLMYQEYSQGFRTNLSHLLFV